MIFGEITPNLIAQINNLGAQTGVTFRITTDINCSNPKLTNVDTGEFIEVGVDMVPGDILEICTDEGNKTISFTHSGVKENYFNYRTSGSSFFQLAHGLNRIKYTVGEGNSHALTIMCQYDTKYGGI